MIHITCTNAGCGRRSRFEREEAGQRVACPSCQTELLLPRTGASGLSRQAAGNPYSLVYSAGGGLAALLFLLVFMATTGNRHLPHAGGNPEHDPRRGIGVAGEEPPTPPSPSPSAIGPGRRSALVIGVEKYSGSSALPDLSYAENDAEELGKVLTRAGYEVVVMTGTRGASNSSLLPTAKNIRVELNRLLAPRTRDDLVLVAFAGHGVQPGDTFYFCPVGAKVNDEATLVSLNTVFQEMEKSPAGFKLLLADACRNDPNARTTLPLGDASKLKSTTRPQEQRVPQNVMALYSCSPGEYAYEPDALKHGLFFHFLILGLQGAADLDGDRRIDREELEKYVKREVSSFANRVMRK
jgi:hypothetical protein